MPNLFNYKTNVANVDTVYSKYSVSRVVSSPKNKLIESEIPADVPENFILDISLYSLSDNSLIFQSSFRPTQDICEIRNLIYSDGSVRRLLVINFDKLQADFDTITEYTGLYQIVINFLIEDFGNVDEPPLAITEISPSRTEIEMRLDPQYRTPISASMLATYIAPQISGEWILDTFKYLCNQTGSLSEKIPTEKTLLTFDIIQTFLPTRESAIINKKETDGLFTASIKTSTQELLNMTYNYATMLIDENLKAKTIFTNKVILDIFSSSFSQALQQYDSKNEFFILV